MPHGMVSLSFYWRASLISHCMKLSRVFWLLSVRVAFLATALLYATCSLLSDAEYKIGLVTMQRQHFQLAARLFPLIRSHRSGPGYLAIRMGDVWGMGDVQRALKDDPYAADLLAGLAQMQLATNDQVGYSATMARLHALPGVK